MTTDTQANRPNHQERAVTDRARERAKLHVEQLASSLESVGASEDAEAIRALLDTSTPAMSDEATWLIEVVSTYFYGEQRDRIKRIAALLSRAVDEPTVGVTADAIMDAIYDLPTSDEPTEAWQPIETAPKDGAEVLAWGYMHDDGGPRDPDGRSFMGEMPARTVARWREPYGWVTDAWGSADGLTHWMPLPDPPAMRAAQGERE